MSKLRRLSHLIPSNPNEKLAELDASPAPSFGPWSAESEWHSFPRWVSFSPRSIFLRHE